MASLVPFFLFLWYPERSVIFSFVRDKIEPIGDDSGRIVIYLHNLNCYNTFVEVTFKRLGNFESKNASLSVETFIYTDKSTLHEKNEMSSKLNKYLVLFSTFVNDIKTIRLDIRINGIDINDFIYMCFAELVNPLDVEFRIILNISSLVLVLFIIFTYNYNIRKSGMISPEQFITNFVLFPAAFSFIPFDVLRQYFTNTFVQVIDNIFSTLISSCFFAVFYWLICEESSQENTINKASVIFDGLLIITYFFYTVFSQIVHSFLDNTNQAESLIKRFLFITIALRVSMISGTTTKYHSSFYSFTLLLLISDIVLYLESIYVNKSLSFVLKKAAYLNYCVYLVYAHWPAKKQIKKQKSRRTYRTLSNADSTSLIG